MIWATVIGSVYLVVGVALLLWASRKEGLPREVGTVFYAVLLWPFFLNDLLDL